jgi:hypothetical protein
MPRGFRRSAHTADRRVSGIFSITWVVNQEKRILVIRITSEDRRPIQSERPVTTKGEPQTLGHSFAAWEVVSGLFPRGQGIFDFDTLRRKGSRVTRIIGPRMINHRVLPKIKKRHAGEKREANANQGTKPPSPPRFRSPSYLNFHLAEKNVSAPQHRKSILSMPYRQKGSASSRWISRAPLINQTAPVPPLQSREASVVPGLPPVTSDPYPTTRLPHPMPFDPHSGRSRTCHPTSARPNVIRPSPTPITPCPDISRSWRHGPRLDSNCRGRLRHIDLSGHRHCGWARRRRGGFGCRCRDRRLVRTASHCTQC